MAPISIQQEDISIITVAKRILSLSSQICFYLIANSFPEPSFTADEGDVPETPEYEALRAPLNDALHDIFRLVNGPKNTLKELIFSHYDLAALQVALDRGFFNHVPLPKASSSTSIMKSSEAEIAQKTGMDEGRTGRILKMLATHRIFKEVEDEPGSFMHTANSAFLSRNPEFYAAADMQMDDMFKVACEASAMISSSPFDLDISRSVFHQRYGTSMYQYYEQRPGKAQRFAKAMGSWSRLNRHIDELYDGFPWESLKTGKVVDIGGGNGHTSVELARMFPSLQFIVQDISPHMLSQAHQDVGDRVTFQQHDFFNPQPVHDASAFIIRQCLHNYNDKDAVKIVRAVVPALKRCGRGTPLLISDIILPESGTTTRFQEHHLRQIDLCMMVLHGAKERSKEDFEKIIKEADQHLEIVNMCRNPMGIGLLEVRLNVE
ncbi:O-methyltransferase-domain-containing protein [Annulohypoxylon maeteangense]|uniref:O-methyltransferase-domain-containing protein n=1 Tax=Annulohypoxylon maeteangense TaxID=1927788 RepID=UPI0020073448|nr:O-methyltransferase-domain-containing protein [Annulohypoxylon maeteangense]KAI0889001.1 O-methyltransferase-domain-containing protein [Annulohypoxylon maeteangense]